MNRNEKVQRKQDIKMAIRRLLPNWFLRLVRRPQVPLKKKLSFLAEPRVLPTEPVKLETLAIIVPCFEHARYINQAFESIVRQTRLPDEVIFIDDCSPDNTTEVLNGLITDYEATNPGQIKFLVSRNEKNQGQALSINKAVELTTADLVMILNDDDYLLHDTVETTLILFQRHPDLALVGGTNIEFHGFEAPTEANRLIKEMFQSNEIDIKITSPAEALKYEDFNSLNMTHSGSTFVRTKAIAAGLYRLKKDRIIVYSDRDFQIRLNLLYPAGTSDKISFCFWRNDSSVDNGLFT